MILVICGYKELDAEGMVISSGKVLKSCEMITRDIAYDWLKKGYTTVTVEKLPPKNGLATLPLQINSVEREKLPEAELGGEANLILKKDDEVVYAIINRRIIKLK